MLVLNALDLWTFLYFKLIFLIIDIEILVILPYISTHFITSELYIRPSNTNTQKNDPIQNNNNNNNNDDNDDNNDDNNSNNNNNNNNNNNDNNNNNKPDIEQATSDDIKADIIDKQKLIKKRYKSLFETKKTIQNNDDLIYNLLKKLPKE